MKLYDEREEELGDELMRALERYLLLQIIDQRWREHLYDMDYLREGIHLRGFAQIDPLVAYKNEGFALFQDLMNSIWSDFARMIYNVEVEVRAEDAAPATRRCRSAQRRRGERRSTTRAARSRTSRARTAARATRSRPTSRTRPAAPPCSSAASTSTTRSGATTRAGAAAARSTRSATGRERARRAGTVERRPTGRPRDTSAEALSRLPVGVGTGTT